MDKRREFGEFLQSRRARLQPQEVGLPALGKRRVPGLRREELAQPAGVSADYYVRLEQGRGAQPSDLGPPAVPGAIANAVFHATGRRVRDFPITLDKLL